MSVLQELVHLQPQLVTGIDDPTECLWEFEAHLIKHSGGCRGIPCIPPPPVMTQHIVSVEIATLAHQPF